MSDHPEHIGHQFHGVYEADKSTPLPGTAKHPQGRLFAPVGGYAGDPWKLAPENWLGQSDTPGHSDPISWHGSNESALPRSDEYEHRQKESTASDDYVDPDYADDDWEPETDHSIDSQDRPMTIYGSAVGMHFGTIKAATDRSKDEARPFIHPARIPESTLVQPPRGTFQFEREGGAIVGGPHKVDAPREENDQRWTDSAANYAEKGTDLVEQGKTLAYANEVEDKGSTSYRTLPETAKTWSEDVMSSKSIRSGAPASKKYGYTDEHSLRGTPHPALVHLAEKGYDPVVLSADKPEMDPSATPEELGGHRARVAEFQAGKTATLRKPS